MTYEIETKSMHNYNLLSLDKKKIPTKLINTPKKDKNLKSAILTACCFFLKKVRNSFDIKNNH